LKKLGFIVVLSFALFAKNNQSFFSAGIIHQNIDNYENTQALHLCYSYMDFNRFGVDIGYAQSFFKGKNKKTRNAKNFSSAYLFPTYLIPLNSYTAFKAKAGYAQNESADDGLGYGVDILFQINKRSGFSLGFQKMSKEINYFMVNTIYKF
jgi:hypothetical protein